MKLALILLICLVGVTYQQVNPWSSFYSPRLFYYPQFKYIDSIKTNEESSIGENESDSIPDIQARVPFRNFNKPQLKFFPNSLFPTSIFPFNFRTFSFTTLTTTIWSTISSTAIIATVQSCIPSSLFVIQPGLTTLTNTCSRRRRETDRQIEAELEDSISPSFVLPLAMNTVASNFARYESKPEILSSYSDNEDNKPRFFIDINDRQNRALNIILTTTSTVTSYSFSTTTIRKIVSLSGPNALSCLPIGYSVC